MLDLLHRDPFGLVRVGSMNLGLAGGFVEARQRPTPKLLRAHGGDVDEKKATLDRRSFRARRRWRIWFGSWFGQWLIRVHGSERLARLEGLDGGIGWSGQRKRAGPTARP